MGSVSLMAYIMASCAFGSGVGLLLCFAITESVSTESEAALEALRRWGDEWAVMAACWKG